MGRCGLLGGAALLLLSVLAYAESPPPASVAAGTGIVNDTGQGSRSEPSDFDACLESCALDGANKDRSTIQSLARLMRYPSCGFRALTAPCSVGDSNWILIPVLVVFVAALIAQSISGFLRDGLLLAFVLFILSLLGTIFSLRQLGEGEPSFFPLLVFLAALVGGAMAYWIVYLRDLLPVVALGFGLLGLFQFEDLKEYRGLLSLAACTLGGGWLFCWRNRPKRTNGRRKSDGSATAEDGTTMSEDRSTA